MPVDRTWWLYLIECRGGGIYTGIALDVEKRYQQHATGKGARYTRMNPPERLLVRRAYPDHRSAAQAEWIVKRLSCLEKWRWAAAYALGIDPSSAVSGPD
ncbi:GIY-YIG nuclease family protein [Acidithiobacillus ferriphilus]|uniref:GIY-YIG nuclease family protein n=1 Tax=Acidithiobacillus ferriphilus TaxID=1689834 RepID=UPI00232D0632|nr:GIY-YIG nuclease family protein [Acidithiobacillus ferriphilus]WCE93240.1 GIY-YIG nuclease family protein [Acidithiobacillus ferriphilus]